MKLLISLFCLIPFLALSQQTAFFETTLYFEDALGNTDSVVVGYDPDAHTGQMNTQFGEEDISAVPFDSIFEVRATHQQGFQTLSTSVPNSKKIIGFTTNAYDPEYNCYPNVEPLALWAYAKHQPITIRWKREDINNSPCRLASFVASHVVPLLVPTWHEDPEPLALSACMAVDSSYTTYLFDYGSFHFYDILPIEGGGMDTVFGLLLHFRNEHAFNSPCEGELVVSAHEQVQPSKIGNSLKAFPNPSSGVFQIAGGEMGFEVFNAQGKWLGSQMSTQLDLSGQADGLYFIRRIGSGAGCTLVKLE